MGKLAFGLFAILLILKIIGLSISWIIVFLPLIVIGVIVLGTTVLFGLIAWFMNMLGRR